MMKKTRWLIILFAAASIYIIFTRSTSPYKTLIIILILTAALIIYHVTRKRDKKADYTMWTEGDADRYMDHYRARILDWKPRWMIAGLKLRLALSFILAGQYEMADDLMSGIISDNLPPLQKARFVICAAALLNWQDEPMQAKMALREYKALLRTGRIGDIERQAFSVLKAGIEWKLNDYNRAKRRLRLLLKCNLYDICCSQIWWILGEISLDERYNKRAEDCYKKSMVCGGSSMWYVLSKDRLSEITKSD